MHCIQIEQKDQVDDIIDQADNLLDLETKITQWY